jgi:hypothetical protein
MGWLKRESGPAIERPSLRLRAAVRGQRLVEGDTLLLTLVFNGSEFGLEFLVQASDQAAFMHEE